MSNTTDTHYKPVPQSFTKKGFQYTCIHRQGPLAIYKQTRTGSDSSRYEVVKIGRHNGYTMGGAYIAPAETYPGSSLWGICGWTCLTLQQAMSKLHALETE